MINRTKNGRPCKNFLTPRLTTMHNLVAVFYIACAPVVTKNWGYAGYLPLGTGAWLRATLTRYRSKILSLFGRRKGPKTLGTLESRPLGRGHGWPPRNTLLSHVRYHTKFRRSRSNRLGLDSGSQRIWERWCPDPLGWRCGWPHRNMLLSHLCYHAKFGYARTNRSHIIMEICRKFWPSCRAFQGHSRSLEPTLMDRLPLTSC